MHKPPEITKLIHDNFWIVLSFAFAQPAVRKVIEQKFLGEWKFLEQSVCQNAERRADRALLEMAIQLRVLDEAEGLSEIFKAHKHPPLGAVNQSNGNRTELHFRDMTNKILHSRGYEWLLADDDPKIIVYSNNSERWKSAEIRLIALMGLIGGLGF